MSICAVDICCDGCLVIEAVNETDVTAYLRSQGWIVDAQRDEHYCPECAKARRLRQRQARTGENNA